MSRRLASSDDSDTLSNRVVHVSVQLFSNEQLAVKMTESMFLLQIMVVSLDAMVSKTLLQSTLHGEFQFFELIFPMSLCIEYFFMSELTYFQRVKCRILSRAQLKREL